MNAPSRKGPAQAASGSVRGINGVLYDTPEKLASFHRNFGFDGRGMISDIGGEIVQIFYTFDAVVVEFVMRGTVSAALDAEGRMAGGMLRPVAPPGR